MARKSTMKTLPTNVQAAVIKAMEGGATIDEIVDQLAGMGHQRSRSAVGRYSKEYAEMAAQQRDMRSAAEAFAGEFGGSDNAEGKLLVQMLTSIGARMIMKSATDEEAADSPSGYRHRLRLHRAGRRCCRAARRGPVRHGRF